MTATTFGQAKARLARVFGNGTSPSDARVLEFCNYAQEAIMRDLASPGPDGKPWTVRGIYVGGVDQIGTTTDSSGVFTLDLPHEVALEVESIQAVDINNGWMSDLSLAGVVDPDFANDLIFLDQGVNGSGLRTYYIPDSANWGSLRVVAKKRFIPAINDASVLCVPNVEAVADMMIYLQKKQGRDNLKDGDDYRTSALRSMKSELDGYLFDPTRTLFRKAAYLADEKTYAATPATLGYVRARIALDLPGALKVGKTQLTRAINRAVERLVERTNELRTANRLRIKTGLNLLTYTRAVNATDTLPYSDWETLRTYIAGSFTPENFLDAEKRAYDLLEARENEALEELRHSTYAVALQAAINAGDKTTLLYFRSKLQLELPAGLQVSDVEMNRLVNQAQRDAIQQRNSLSATELYSDVDGPSVLTAPTLLADSDQLVYSDFEVIRLFVMAEMTPANAGDLKAQAYTLIERNLAKEVAATRNLKWHCLLKLPHYTFGWVRGTIGLGLSEQGFSLSDQKLARMINEVEESLAYTPNFVGGEAEYQLGCIGGLVEMPDDVERVIYADVCGWPVDVKHRSFEFLRYPQGKGVQSNCSFLNGLWVFGGSNALQDRGLSDNGNRQYQVTGCTRGALHVVVKRRWMPKKKDTDVMLVQNLDAIRLRIEAKMSRDTKDLASAGALEAASDRAMDRQLENSVGSATLMPRINFPGARRAGYRQLLRRY